MHPLWRGECSSLPELHLARQCLHRVSIRYGAAWLGRWGYEPGLYLHDRNWRRNSRQAAFAEWPGNAACRARTGNGPTVVDSLPPFTFAGAGGNTFNVTIDIADSAVDESEPLVQFKFDPATAPALFR